MPAISICSNLCMLLYTRTVVLTTYLTLSAFGKPSNSINNISLDHFKAELQMKRLQYLFSVTLYIKAPTKYIFINGVVYACALSVLEHYSMVLYKSAEDPPFETGSISVSMFGIHRKLKFPGVKAFMRENS